MKTRCQFSKLITFFCLATFFLHSVSFASDCALDFNRYPYQPTGACIGPREKINYWNSFPTTLCCANALTVLSQALAVRANITGAQSNIFIAEELWTNCSVPFPRQQSVSLHSCGFDNLFYGSSKCSTFSLDHLQIQEKHKQALAICANQLELFSFEDACRNCAAAILESRDELLEQNGLMENNAERAICGVAVIISIAAENLDNRPFINDFYGCLPALDVLDPGYIKLKYSMVKIVFAILLTTVGLMLVVILIKYVSRHRPPRPVQLREISAWSGLYRFSKAEIENAINFGNERKDLGRGSAGRVYKGVLPSGQIVAVKHIFKSNTSDSFTREVEGLSRVRHPNLVCLFGCCMEGGEQYLVYEYCSAGNLAQHLLRKDSLLTWERRVKILRDCALALRYLHHYIDGCIVHRDIKLTNILLTDKLDPKLSDFGLARMLGMEESKVFTDVRGTIGYMDPEYMSNAKLTCASDIYSFGIVALQLLSGQKVIELDLDARDQLTRKAKDVCVGKRPLTDFEDPRLNGRVGRVDFESILQVAVLCVAKSSKGRPTIDVVFDEMDKAWKNTAADLQRTKREMSSSGTPLSRSLEIIPL